MNTTAIIESTTETNTTFEEQYNGSDDTEFDKESFSSIEDETAQPPYKLRKRIVVYFICLCVWLNRIIKIK